jgi:hypothetical protein
MYLPPYASYSAKLKAADRAEVFSFLPDCEKKTFLALAGKFSDLVGSSAMLSLIFFLDVLI